MQLLKNVFVVTTPGVILVQKQGEGGRVLIELDQLLNVSLNLRLWFAKSNLSLRNHGMFVYV